MPQMNVLTTMGVEVLFEVHRKDMSAVGKHWNAVQRFLATGETDQLRRFRGVKVGGRTLMTDPDEIEDWAAAGGLDFEDIYEDPR